MNGPSPPSLSNKTHPSLGGEIEDTVVFFNEDRRKIFMPCTPIKTENYYILLYYIQWERKEKENMKVQKHAI